MKIAQNRLKHLTLTVHGLIFGRAYYRKDICILHLGGLFSGGLIFGRAFFLGRLIIGILRYLPHAVR